MRSSFSFLDFSPIVQTFTAASAPIAALNVDISPLHIAIFVLSVVMSLSSFSLCFRLSVYHQSPNHYGTIQLLSPMYRTS